MQNLQSRGVTIPANQGNPTNQGAPNSVVSAMRVSTILVEYFDQNGRHVIDAVLEANGNYYRPDNSVAWANSLKPLNEWLVKGVRGKLPSTATDLAGVGDAVQVVPEG